MPEYVNLTELRLSDPVTLLDQLDGKHIDLEQAKRMFKIAPVVRRFGTWAVTELGLECLITYCPISKDQLSEAGLLRHMLDKGWVIPDQFADGLDSARAYHLRGNPARLVPEHQSQPENERAARIRQARQPGHLTERFLILKRDGYRCQLCGATAQDGVRLEVDHKIARAKGGSDHISNKWTLCWPCNRGKGTREL